MVVVAQVAATDPDRTDADLAVGDAKRSGGAVVLRIKQQESNKKGGAIAPPFF